MAQSGNRVLLVDTDMRRPRLHRAFGVPNDVGISSLVVGEGSLDKAVKSDGGAEPLRAAVRPLPPNPAELLHTRAFKELLRSGRASSSTASSWTARRSTRWRTPRCWPRRRTAWCWCSRRGKTNREAARRALRSLADVQAHMFGAVLNDVDLTAAALRRHVPELPGLRPTQDGPKDGVAPS